MKLTATVWVAELQLAPEYAGAAYPEAPAWPCPCPWPPRERCASTAEADNPRPSPTHPINMISPSRVIVLPSPEVVESGFVLCRPDSIDPAWAKEQVSSDARVWASPAPASSWRSAPYSLIG